MATHPSSFYPHSTRLACVENAHRSLPTFFSTADWLQPPTLFSLLCDSNRDCDGPKRLRVAERVTIVETESTICNPRRFDSSVASSFIGFRLCATRGLLVRSLYTSTVLPSWRSFSGGSFIPWKINAEMHCYLWMQAMQGIYKYFSVWCGVLRKWIVFVIMTPCTARDDWGRAEVEEDIVEAKYIKILLPFHLPDPSFVDITLTDWSPSRVNRPERLPDI